MEEHVVCELAEDEQPPAKRNDGPRRHDVEMLWISGVVVVASFLLSVRGDDRVGPIWPDSVNLPETCASRSWFGVSCPGCGLTRSFVHLAHGDFSASLAIHRIGWVLAALVLAQFPYRAALILLPAYRERLRRIGGFVSWILLAALLVNWLLGGVAPAR